MLNFPQRVEYLRVKISESLGISDTISDFMQSVFGLHNVSNYSKWKKQGKIPTKHLDTLVNTYKVNPKWLKEGVGDVFSEDISKLSNKVINEKKDYTNSIDENSKDLNFIERLECLKIIMSKRYNWGGRLSDFTQNVFNLKSPASYNQWEKDGKIPDKYLAILIRDYKVNGVWLNEGIGTMFVQEKPEYDTSPLPTSIAADRDGGSNYLLQIIKENADKLAQKDKVIVELRDELAKLRKD